MKFKYLGTAAADGVPALFCNCPICNKIRRLGGKNFRTRSQAIIGEDLLIDLSPDTYMHTIQYGIKMDRIKYLLITHSHDDHFASYELALRGVAYAHNLSEPDLTMYCNEHVYKKFMATDMFPPVREHINVRLVEPYKTYSFGKYTIVPLPARHTQPEQSLLYVICAEGKTILYGNDTGYPFEEVFEFIGKEKIKFDLVSLDCTLPFEDIPDTGTHMCLSSAERACRRLRELGAAAEKTKFYLNHFSHNGRPFHDEVEKAAEKFGAKVAYDGLELEF